MRKILFFILIAGAWLDGHAQSLPQCPEEKPEFLWDNCVGTSVFPGNALTYVGGFKKGDFSGRGTLVSVKGYTLVDGFWKNLATVTVAGRAWRWVADSEQSVMFLLSDSIRREGSFRRAWVMDAYFEPTKEGRLSNRTLWRLDCANEKFQFLVASDYSGAFGSGKLLDSHSFPVSVDKADWEYIQPGTVGDGIAKYVCNYKLENK